MYDIHVVLNNAPGALGSLGRTLGQHGIGLEGGGVFTLSGEAHTHFVVEEGKRAREVLAERGFDVRDVRRPLIRKLSQARPGELGEIADTIARAGVNILVQYSDHHNRLILLTDNDSLAADVTEKWKVPS